MSDQDEAIARLQMAREIDRLEAELRRATDALHDAEVALELAQQTSARRQARIRALELEMDEAATLCEQNGRELDALRAALAPILRSAS